MMWGLLALTLLLALSARAEVDIMDVLERSNANLKSRMQQDRSSSSEASCRASYRSTDFSRAMDYRNALFEEAANILRQETNMTVELSVSLIRRGLQQLADSRQGYSGRQIDLVNSACSNQQPTCDPSSPFRTITGVCNNLRYPFWGSLNIAFRRFLPAEYTDGVSEPFGRTETHLTRSLGQRQGPRPPPPGPQGPLGPPPPPNGSPSPPPGPPGPPPPPPGPPGPPPPPNGPPGPPPGPPGPPPPPPNNPCPPRQGTALPSPRFVSHTYHTDSDVPDPNHTLLLVQFAQFVDHDLSLTPNPDETGCCQTGNNNAGNCFAITVPSSDPFISLNNLACLTFSRSTAFCQTLTSTREQMNVLTAFIDASNVYGSDDATSMLLRTLQGGQLKTSLSPSSKVLLPVINGTFTAGDKRAIETPGLTTMHTIFMREHNRIAAAFAAAQPGLSDDQIFQRARALVGAQMQNIVYGQFHGEILGQSTQDQLGLSLGNGYSNYNPNVDPSIRNSFATAAYRFGHTLLQGIVKPRDLKTGSITNSFTLGTTFFNSSSYLGQSGNGAEEIVFGIIDENAQSFDQFVTQEVTNLLQFAAGSTRSDLVARNIQRGRDHGLPSYLEFRNFCGLSNACSWNNPPPEISQAKWNQLSQIYNSPADIDLFTGGISESSFNGGLLGPTFNCIIGNQFKAIKDGDRFFFTHQGQAGSFNPPQLQNLRSRNLGDVICDNTMINATPLNVFRKNSPMRPCSQNNQLNLGLFM